MKVKKCKSCIYLQKRNSTFFCRYYSLNLYSVMFDYCKKYKSGVIGNEVKEK